MATFVPIQSKTAMRKLLILLLALLFTHVGRTQQIDQNVLRTIKNKAEETHSDAIIIVKGNEEVYREHFGRKEEPVYIASAGKSLVSLAIGNLLMNGQLDSLDQPIHTLFPEWRQGLKKTITIRMLLNHTSGLQDYSNASIELEPAPTYKVANVINLALAAELTNTPGSAVFYSNKATALLAGIVEKASGKRFDHFFVDTFYKAMNISDYEWVQDEQGNPTTHGAFIMKPSDLLKFGQLVVQKGIYDGKRLVSQDWIEESLSQGQDFTPIWGLLWWRLPKYEHRIIDKEIWNSWLEAGVSKDFLTKIRPLKGILYESRNDFYNALNEVFGDAWNQVLNDELPESVTSSKRIYSKEIIAYYAQGYRGNYLVIIPGKQLIAVRCADPVDFNHKTDTFEDFVTLVSEMVN